MFLYEPYAKTGKDRFETISSKSPISDTDKTMKKRKPGDFIFLEIKKYKSIAKLVTPESGKKIRTYEKTVLNRPSLKGKKVPQ
jgi:hypothetical protein